MAENKDLRTPDERAHAVLSASGSHRWMHCTGSVALSLRVDPTLKRGQTPYAAEGSAAHFLCEHCLETDKSPHGFLGMKIVPEGPLFPADANDEDIKAETGHQYVFVVNEEMADAVETYLMYIAQLVDSCLFESQQFVEKEGNLQSLWQHVYGKLADHEWLQNMFGTSDFILEAFIDGILHIVDFKYGAGIAVDPDDNSQLMYYAAAYAGDNIEMYDEVHLHIVQPRAWHANGECRVWKTSGQYIHDFFKEKGFPAAIECVEVEALVAEAEQDVMDGIYDTSHVMDTALPYLNPDPEACQWCDAIHDCPKIKAEMNNLAKADFMTDNPPAKATDLPMPNTAQQFSRAMIWLPVIKKWIKSIEAGADNFTKNGHDIPGFKRVEKRGTRKWLDEDEVVKLCKKKRLKKGEYVTEKLITPAQLEKVLGYEAIEKLFIKESSGTTVAPMSDKRPEVRIDAASDFDDGDDELEIPGK